MTVKIGTPLACFRIRTCRPPSHVGVLKRVLIRFVEDRDPSGAPPCGRTTGARVGSGSHLDYQMKRTCASRKPLRIIVIAPCSAGVTQSLYLDFTAIWRATCAYLLAGR